jgi:3',5'-cyclic AMP phosphodiesterase CpdA
MRTIVHTSDLHFPLVDARVMASLSAFINDLAPDLVVVSGDLTQRARRSQFLAAAAFLKSLRPPLLVVPGNHDVPMFNVPARVLTPFAAYRTHIAEDLEPVFDDAEMLLVGLNSVRTVLFSDEGRLNVGQADRGAARLRQAAPGVIKIVVTHHPFDVPQGQRQDKMIGRSRMAMERLAAAGTDIFLAGHLHISHVGGTATRYRIAGHSALLVQAGTMSTRERGEPNSFNVLRIADGQRVTIDRMAWTPAASAFTACWHGAFRQDSGEWSAIAPTPSDPSPGAAL